MLFLAFDTIRNESEVNSCGDLPFLAIHKKNVNTQESPKISRNKYLVVHSCACQCRLPPPRHFLYPEFVSIVCAMCTVCWLLWTSFRKFYRRVRVPRIACAVVSLCVALRVKLYVWRCVTRGTYVTPTTIFIHESHNLRIIKTNDFNENTSGEPVVRRTLCVRFFLLNQWMNIFDDEYRRNMWFWWRMLCVIIICVCYKVDICETIMKWIPVDSGVLGK